MAETGGDGWAQDGRLERPVLRKCPLAVLRLYFLTETHIKLSHSHFALT